MRKERVSQFAPRKRAVVFALFYLFLSTFGVFTHEHALPEVALDTPTYTAKECAEKTPQTTLHHHKTTSPAHCSFCDWQANSVSTALFLRTTNLLRAVRIESTPLLVSLHESTVTASSSRAPPLS